MNLMNPHNNRKKHWTMKIKQLRSALCLVRFQNCPFCSAVSRQISGLSTSGLAGVWMSVGKTKDRLQNAPLMTVNILLSLPLLRSIRDCHAESVDHPGTGFAAPPHKRMKTSDTRCTSCFFLSHWAPGERAFKELRFHLSRVPFPVQSCSDRRWERSAGVMAVYLNGCNKDNLTKSGVL